MNKKNKIDITTEEEKQKVLEILQNCNNKSQVYEYFGLSDNSTNAKYLNDIANEVGFDFSIYKQRRKKYCKECGKEITSKYAKIFCSSSCAATFNNKLRERKHKENIVKPKPIKKTKPIKKPNIKHKFEKICQECGKEFLGSTANAKYCSNQCIAKGRHKEQYKNFLENNEKFCRGNYVPKNFKEFFLQEQDNKCAICGCEPIHNGKPLVFVLDHINGDASDNRRENLRLVCPNCDSQLDTFKSKNKFSTRRNYWKEHLLNQFK